MNASNVLRAILMAAIFGLAVIFATGALGKLGAKAGAAVKSAT